MGVSRCEIINVDVTWQDISPGGMICEAANSQNFLTGDWRVEKPVWNPEKCKQCSLCFPVCPDNSIPSNENAQRSDFDYDHCKGCGVCAKVCPFGAITMEAE